MQCTVINHLLSCFKNLALTLHLPIIKILSRLDKKYCLGISVNSKKAELLSTGKYDSASCSLKMCKRRQKKISTSNYKARKFNPACNRVLSVCLLLDPVDRRQSWHNNCCQVPVKHMKFHLNTMKWCLLSGELNIGTSNPERLWSLYLWDIKNSSRSSLEQPTVADSAWAAGFNYMISRGPFQPQEFCDARV